MKLVKLALLCVLISFTTPGLAASEALFRLGNAETIPGAFAGALDVRIGEEGRIILALGRDGVVTCPATGFDGCSPILSGTEGRGPFSGSSSSSPAFFFSALLAQSNRVLLAASPFAQMLAFDRESAVSTTLGFAAAVDIDISGSTAAILGADRDSRGRWAPEGAIVWFGSIEHGRRGLKPILFSDSGDHATSIGKCGKLLVGGVRFYANGSLVVVPGVEPGVHLFDAGGRLIRTWQTEAFGFLSECPLDEEQAHALADMEQRMAWLNARRVVDEVLDLPSGPGLIIRSVKNESVSWDLLQLGFDGSNHAERLPISSRSPYTRLRGDLRGNQVVFLLVDHEPPGEPSAPTRLVRGKVLQ